MKLKLLFASLCSLALAGSVHATKLTITVQDFKFTPADATINLGDTVVYTWLNGSHTTTSTTIPSGAAAWDSPMTAAVSSFTYVPAVAGVYNYKCTPHAAMGHLGKFTVTGTSDINNYELAKSVFNIFPNPAQSQITLAFNTNKSMASSVMIVDLTGKTVKDEVLSKTQHLQIDVNTLANGTYFVRVIQEGRTYVRKFVISR